MHTSFFLSYLVVFFLISCSQNNQSLNHSESGGKLQNHQNKRILKKKKKTNKDLKKALEKKKKEKKKTSNSLVDNLVPHYPSNIKPYPYADIQKLNFPSVTVRELVDFIKLNNSEDWFGLYMNKHKVGYLNQGWKIIDNTKVQYTEHFHMEMKVLGEVKKIDIDSVSEFDSKTGSLLKLTSIQKVGPTEKIEILNKIKDNLYKIKVEMKAGGINAPAKNMFEKEYNESNANIKTSELAQNYIISKLKTTNFTKNKIQAFKLKQFSPIVLKFSDSSFRILSNSQRFISGIKTSVYTVELINSEPQSRMLVITDEKGRLLIGAKGGIVIKREDKVQARSLNVNFDVGLAAIIKTDLSFLKPTVANKLTLKINGKFPNSINFLNTYRYTLKQNPLILILQKDKPTKFVKTQVPAELKKYLQPEKGLEVKDPFLKNLARKAVNGISSPIKQIEKLTYFVGDYIQDTMRSDIDSALMVAKIKRGDCTEHSLLLTALLRSLGYPARQVGGVAYIDTCPNPSCIRGFAYHAWVQVYIEKWIDIDPTWKQFPADVTHIMLGTEKQLDWLESIGNISFLPIKNSVKVGTTKTK